jgi:hypothetical protein
VKLQGFLRNVRLQRILCIGQRGQFMFHKSSPCPVNASNLPANTN